MKGGRWWRTKPRDKFASKKPKPPKEPPFPACGWQAKTKDERVGHPRIVSRVDLCSTRHAEESMRGQGRLSPSRRKTARRLVVSTTKTAPFEKPNAKGGA